MADPNEAPPMSMVETKRELRQRMRTMRRSLADRPERSARIVERLASLDAVRQAKHLLLYDSIVGEVETGDLFVWCDERGIETAVPESGVDASWPDVVIVPGTAFTLSGERIGQGGGWYDRFLPGCRRDAVLIGVAFSPQIVVSIPTEEHDVPMHVIVTDDATHDPTASTDVDPSGIG